MLWLGLAGHFLGLQHGLDVGRGATARTLLNIMELITGNRNHYAMLKPGGVRRDIQVAEDHARPSSRC